MVKYLMLILLHFYIVDWKPRSSVRWSTMSDMVNSSFALNESALFHSSVANILDGLGIPWPRKAMLAICDGWHAGQSHTCTA